MRPSFGLMLTNSLTIVAIYLCLHLAVIFAYVHCSDSSLVSLCFLSLIFKAIFLAEDSLFSSRISVTWTESSKFSLSLSLCILYPGHVGSSGGHRSEGFSAPWENWSHRPHRDHMIPPLHCLNIHGGVTLSSGAGRQAETHPAVFPAVNWH